MNRDERSSLRRQVLVLCEQLDSHPPLVGRLDPFCDRVFTAEVCEEVTRVWCHKARIVLFLSAARHFSSDLEARGVVVRNLMLDRHSHGSMAAALAAQIGKMAPGMV